MAHPCYERLLHRYSGEGRNLSLGGHVFLITSAVGTIIIEVRRHGPYEILQQLH